MHPVSCKEVFFLEPIIIFVVFLILSSLLRSFSGAAKKSGGRKPREVIALPDLPDFPDFPDISRLPDIADTRHAPHTSGVPDLPPGRLANPQPEAPLPLIQKGRERKAKPGGCGLKLHRERSAAPGGQISELEELFYGEKLPLAIISAMVLSPPRAKDPYRPNC